jgi:peptide deformylase
MTKILMHGDPFLERKCQDVEKVNNKIQDELHLMATVMFKNNGMGLAANQIGLDRNMFVMYNFRKKKIRAYINPVVLYLGTNIVEEEEGCLSMPNYSVIVPRPSKLTVKFTDYRGRNRTTNVSGIYARCIMHELEHLEGKYMLQNLDLESQQKILLEKPWIKTKI